MLTITTNARKRLSKLLDEYKHNNDHVIRLVLDDHSKFSISLSTPKPDDVLIENDNKPLVVMKKGTCDFLNSMILDAEGSGENQKLRIRQVGKPTSK